MAYNQNNPNGSATSANSAPVVIASDQAALSVKPTDGTNAANVLKSDGTAAGQNAQMVSPTYQSQTFSFTSVTAGTAYDVGNYKSVSIQITSFYTGTTPTITPQISNDNTNWATLSTIGTGQGSGTSLSSAGMTATGMWSGPLPGRYFRLNQTGAYTSGTTAGTIVFSTVATVPFNAQTNISAQQSGTWLVSGPTATGAAVPSNGFYKGLLAQTANPTAATAGNLVGALADKLGKQVVVGSIRDLKVQQVTTITSSTSETTILTAVASTYLDLYGLVITNTSATAVNVAIKDATAGTTRITIAVPAGDTRNMLLPESAAHNQSAVNNNWTATCSASVASVLITAFAVKNT